MPWFQVFTSVGGRLSSAHKPTPTPGLTSPSSQLLTGLSHSPLATSAPSAQEFFLPRPVWLYWAHINVVITFKILRKTTSCSKNMFHT